MPAGGGNSQFSPTDHRNKVVGHPLTTEGHKIVLLPRHKLTGTATPRQSTHPYFNISDDEDQSPTNDSGEINLPTAKDRKTDQSLRFHMDISTWDVIHKEVIDWHDSSWSSMHLPGDTMCKINKSF